MKSIILTIVFLVMDTAVNANEVKNLGIWTSHRFSLFVEVTLLIEVFYVNSLQHVQKPPWHFNANVDRENWAY